MLTKTCTVATLVLALPSFGSFASKSYAQAPVAGGAQAAPCSRPEIRCPAPASTSTWVHINLEPDSGSVCRFDPHDIQDLRIPLGSHVAWTFCSKCEVDTEVVLTVPPGEPGLFDKFSAFFPIPQSAHEVAVDVPCNGTWQRLGIYVNRHRRVEVHAENEPERRRRSGHNRSQTRDR